MRERTLRIIIQSLCFQMGKLRLKRRRNFPKPCPLPVTKLGWKLSCPMISPMPFLVLVEARKDSRHKEGMPWGSRGTLFALKCIGNISGVSSLRTWPTLNYLSENGMYRSAETPSKHRLCARKPESPHQSPQRKVSCPSGLSQVQEGKDKREEPELSSSSTPTH